MEGTGECGKWWWVLCLEGAVPEEDRQRYLSTWLAAMRVASCSCQAGVVRTGKIRGTPREMEEMGQKVVVSLSSL